MSVEVDCLLNELFDLSQSGEIDLSSLSKKSMDIVDRVRLSRSQMVLEDITTRIRLSHLQLDNNHPEDLVFKELAGDISKICKCAYIPGKMKKDIQELKNNGVCNS